MIYKLKQKIRHSALGNKVADKLGNSFLFPFLYNIVLKLNLSEKGRAFKEKAADISKVVAALEDEPSKKVFQEILNCKIQNRWNIKNFSPDQYFPKDVICLSKEEVFVDCGAYTGDTIDDFRKNTSDYYKKIVALEPDPVNFAKLKELEIPRSVFLNIGAWNKAEKLEFYMAESGSALEKAREIKDASKVTVSVAPIDSLAECSDMTFLKMDIEGAELNALKGAEKTIRKNKPKLAICIYHKEYDFIEIPLWVMSLNMGYKLYIRHHSDSGAETVLYAI